MRSPWKSSLATLWVIASLATGVAKAQAPQSPELAEAIAAYRNGGYSEAAARLNELLYPLKLRSRDDILDARITLALCYYILDRPLEAKAEFLRALDQDPDLSLDPLYTPPEILAFFAEIKANHERTRQTPSTVPSPPAEARPSKDERQSLALDLAPFGIAQLRAGRPAHGALLLSGEVLLTGTATGTWLWLVNKQDEVDGGDGYLDTDQEALVFTWVKRTNHAAFAGSALLFTYGLGDALWHVRSRDARVSFTPAVPGAELGVGVTLRF